MQNFIILCHGRSGSTFLQKELDKHTGIYCYGELYHPKYMQFLINESNSFFRNRQKNPIEYIKYMYQRRGKSLVGSKILYPEISIDGVKKICMDQTYKIIFLYRKNILEAAISMVLTNKMGLWHIDKGHKAPIPAPFAVNIDEVKNYIKNITTFIETVKSSKNANIFPVAYEELINLEAINKICDFLGVGHKTTLTSNTDKMCNEQMYEVITNRKELEDEFGKIYGYLGKPSDIEYWKKI